MKRSIARLSLCAALLAPLPLAAADQPMTGAEFDAYTVGKTLIYGSAGEPYGTEEYLPGRRVMWSFVGDECREGIWFERQSDAGPEICFEYKDTPGDLQCWWFYRGEKGLMARFVAEGDSTELTEVEQSAQAMNCPGPDLGV